MAEHRSRCSNRINGLTCWRDAGEDGLCNVCRAAKRRGEQARERNRAARASAAASRGAANRHRVRHERAGRLLEQVNPAMFEWFTNPAEPPAQVILRCINQEFESMGREGVVTACSVLPGKFQVVTVTYVMPPLKAGGKFQHRHAVYVDGVCQSSGISGHTDNGANV